jgi:membrane protein YdbS with pleckstrin-like domain
MLAPIVRADQVPALVRDVLPGFDLESLDWQRLHPRAYRRAVKPALLFGAFMVGPLMAPFGPRALALLPFTLGWMALASWKHLQRTQWATTDGAVVFRSGWLWRSVTVVPVAKIQTVTSHESPFDRRHAMARVQVDTAGAGERSHKVSIPYLARETARALHERLAVQAAETSFRW